MEDTKSVISFLGLRNFRQVKRKKNGETRILEVRASLKLGKYSNSFGKKGVTGNLVIYLLFHVWLSPSNRINSYYGNQSIILTFYSRKERKMKSEEVSLSLWVNVLRYHDYVLRYHDDIAINILGTSCYYTICMPEWQYSFFQYFCLSGSLLFLCPPLISKLSSVDRISGFVFISHCLVPYIISLGTSIWAGPIHHFFGKILDVLSQVLDLNTIRIGLIPRDKYLWGLLFPETLKL